MTTSPRVQPTVALLVALLALGSAPTLLAATRAPHPSGFVPIAEVRPGMEVTAWTVFSGNEVEPVKGRVLGIARNHLGPQRHVVLIELTDARIRHTGIAHGMSGSPAYIGERLLGAVSLVLSPFPRDAIAGVTPIEYMLGEENGPPTVLTRGQRLLPEPREAIPAGALLRPIGTPLMMAGVDPHVLAHTRSAFARLGLDPVLGGGGNDPESSLTSNDLQPGQPVAAVLADGDLTLAATGAITHRDGDRIYAFGHPFLLQGQVAIPMAPATVVATLADQTYSSRLANVGPPVGRIDLDRTTAVLGQVGTVPRMFPLKVEVTGAANETSSYNFRVAESPWLTPLVAQVLVGTTLALRWDYDEEATYRLRGTIRLTGGRTLALNDAYAVAADPRGTSPSAIAADFAAAFATLYTNPFAAAEIAAIDLRYDIGEHGLIDCLEGIFLDPEPARAGEAASLRVILRGRRGPRRLVALTVPIPTWASGRRLVVRVADSNTLRGESSLAGSPHERAATLDQLIDLLADRPRADCFYVQLLALTPDAVLFHKRLPSLPGSIAEVLERGGSAYRRLPRALVWEHTIPVEGVAIGSQELPIQVRP